MLIDSHKPRNHPHPAATATAPAIPAVFPLEFVSLYPIVETIWPPVGLLCLLKKATEYCAPIVARLTHAHCQPKLCSIALPLGTRAPCSRPKLLPRSLEIVSFYTVVHGTQFARDD